jgi:nucleotide-binding universal stress UspA family protein
MASVLLATDGSDYARQAARRAIELAEEQGVPLHVICVVDKRRFDEPALSSAELATIYAEDYASVSVADIAEVADESAVTVHGETRHGIPHEVILDYADEVDAGTIVVGEHGDHDEHFSGIGRKVMDMSDREVVVVEGEWS